MINTLCITAVIIAITEIIFPFATYGQLQLLSDINTEAADNDRKPKLLTTADSRMYFIYNDALWRSNGSSEATIKLKTFVSISDLVTVGNTLFSADDGVHGKELWKSRGYDRSTELVSEMLIPYPNPFTESLAIRIKGSDGEQFQVSVFTGNGFPVERFTVPANASVLQIGSAWQKGFIFLR